MSKLHKFLSILLAVMMVISIVPVTASATASGDWEYNVLSEENKTAQITEYKGSKKEIEIPSLIDGYTITTIGEWAFYYCDKLTSIKIPDSVTLIDKWSFAYCKGLTSITIPESVITIGEHAFSFCENLENITIPNSVTTVGASAFYCCYNLNEIAIPNSVILIGEEAFSLCKNLTTVTIPSSVTIIGQKAFSTCENLTTIIVDSENPYYSTDEYNSILFNKDKTSLIMYLRKNPQTSYNIPDSVTTICDFAFAGCKDITSITIGENVETIGNNAFVYCTGLTNLIIPDSVKTIGDYAFYNCFNLQSVKIGNGVTSIGNYAFSLNEYLNPGEEMHLKELKLGNSVTTIGIYAFQDCKMLTSVTIPDSVKTIEKAAFSDCVNIEDVYYGGSKEQWNAITIDKYNEPLTTASIHYNYHMHKYNAIVTASTCTERGYTTYTCECGDSYVDDYVDAIGHRYTSEITIPATHMTEGEKTFTCSCGDTYTETIDKIAAHNYESVITEPTCTEGGYTTYTCECGHSYIGDYVDVFHRSTKQYERVITSPTCAEEGSKEIVTCCMDCNMIINREIIAITKLPHSPADAVEENYVAPACTINGSKDVVVYCSVCDEEISRETVTLDATGHADNDGNGYCDVCNELLDPTVECECNCHKDGVSGFFWNIKMFFSKIFGTNKMCECGVAHY